MQNEDRSVSTMRVAVLSVTYSDRIRFLEIMVKGCVEQGVRDFVLFLNNIPPSAREKLATLEKWINDQPGITLILLDSDRNIGSAAAYARGIETVRSRLTDIDALLLMDDDNMLAEDSLTHLKHAALSAPGSAIAAVRSARAYMAQAAQTGRVEAPMAGEAYGFDIRKRPLRILRRMKRLSRPVGRSGHLVTMDRSPFGGLFIPLPLLHETDPPRADFVIYAEDYEYSERLSRRGGLVLALDAIVHDQEESWNVAGNPRRSNISLLASSNPDFRLYYGLRNAIFLDQRRAGGPHFLIFLFNLCLLTMATCIGAAFRSKFRNIPVICRAIGDGLSGHLGPNPAFPLP